MPEQTTPQQLASPEDLAAWLPVDKDDPRLLLALTAASNRFRLAVRHPVHHVEADEVWLDSDGSRALLLPYAPVTELGDVLVNGRLEGDVEWSEKGIIRRAGRGRWPDRFRSVHVTYSHGYDPIPGEIQDVVIEQARLVYAVLPGLSSMQVGGEAVSFASGRYAGVGVSAAWTLAVENYGLNRGDRA